jgi:hypothetical protein
MRKSFILLTICALAGLWSCQSRIEDETPITYASDESEVEITVAADRTPRNVPSATPDENIIDNLDILLFDSNGKFICWRATFKINGKLRTTLPVGKDYDAYFLANCRSFIGEMLPDKVTEKQYRQQADWEVFRKTLVDANPQRLLQENTAFTSLPMWGMLKKQDVNDRVINYWPLLSLTRSVASVDVYVANGIDYFILKDITLFHVPDKGFLGNVPANVTDGQALEASSPADMQTGLTLESDSYNSTDRSIANKLYLYDNDTENETADKKHTRLVIGAEPHTDEQRRKIERILGVKAYNSFGMTEMNGPGVAFECTEQNGMHLWEDCYLVEIINPETGEPVPDGEIGELVLTTLDREMMPLIRYRTRDLTRILPGTCPCGRTHLRIDRIKGRSDDMFIIKGVNIFPMQVEKVLVQFPELGSNYLITLETISNQDEMIVEVELSDLSTDNYIELEKVRKAISRRLKDEILVTPKVKLVKKGSLPQSEGKAVRVKDLRDNK